MTERRPKLPERSCVSCGVLFVPRDHRQRQCREFCGPEEQRKRLAGHVCGHCGVTFNAIRSDQAYCSSRCRRRRRNWFVRTPCEGCGGEKHPESNRRTRFCSPACKKATYAVERAKPKRVGLARKYALCPGPRRRREYGATASPAAYSARSDVVSCPECGHGITAVMSVRVDRITWRFDLVCPRCAPFTKRRGMPTNGARFKRTLGERPPWERPEHPRLPRGEEPPDWWRPVPESARGVKRVLREQQRRRLWREGAE